MNNTDQHVSQIYWPTSLCGTNLSGYVIGFNVNSFVVVVLGIRDVPSLVEAKKIIENLDNHDEVIKSLLQQTHGPPKILGHFKVMFILNLFIQI